MTTKPTATKTIRVPIDTLEYTRKGLRTRGPLSLQVGKHHRVVLVRPDRVQPIGGGTVGFPKDSAFPLPGTLMMLWRAKRVGAAFTYHDALDVAWQRGMLQLYGHGSAQGDEVHNKALSERRARVGVALVTRDVDAFTAIADEDGWDIAELQSMLRTLACDPGPVDGEPERLTKAGVAMFAERYNRGVYHHVTTSTPAATLPTDGELDDDTRAAVLEAFVLAHGLDLGADALHPTHPWQGCSLYNARTYKEGAPNRRLTVVTHDGVPPLSEHAPCVQGNEQACAVVDDEPQRCMWYREHVQDPAPAQPELFDPRWKWLGNDRHLLSALTTEDDDAAVTFEVFDGDDRVSEVLAGFVHAGVAQVVWKSPYAWDEGDGRPELETPRFRVVHPHAGEALFGPWPEVANVRVLKVCEDVEVVRARSGGIRLVARDGSYDYLRRFAELIEESAHHIALEFPSVPLDARLDMVLETGDFVCTLLESVVVAQFDGDCGPGEQCHDLPPRVGAPNYALDDLDLGPFATIDDVEGDPSTFDLPPPPAYAQWLADDAH